MRTVASVEDRLWLELVEDHGAKLAETPWPSPKRHIRRTILIGGAALAVCGMVAALVVGLTSTSPPADAGSATVPPSKIAKGITRGLDMQSPVAEARIDNVLLVVAHPVRPRGLPSSAQTLPTSYLCFTTLGTGNGGVICNDPGSISAYGAYLVLGPPHGPWNAWGYAPAGTTKVTVDGRSFPLYGRFYKAIVPPGLHYVVFTTPTGLKSYPGP